MAEQFLRRDDIYKIAHVETIDEQIDFLGQACKSAGHAQNLKEKGYVWAWHDGHRYHYLKESEFHATFCTLEQTKATAHNRVINALIAERTIAFRNADRSGDVDLAQEIERQLNYLESMKKPEGASHD